MMKIEPVLLTPKVPIGGVRERPPEPVFEVKPWQELSTPTPFEMFLQVALENGTAVNVCDEDGNHVYTHIEERKIK